MSRRGFSALLPGLLALAWLSVSLVAAPPDPPKGRPKRNPLEPWERKPIEGRFRREQLPELVIPAPKTFPEVLKARRDAARLVYQGILERYKRELPVPGMPGGGTRTSEPLFISLAKWSRNWLEAEKALSDKKTDQVAAYQAHFDRVKELERLEYRAVNEGGFTPLSEAVTMTYYRLEAEVWYHQATGKLPKESPKPPPAPKRKQPPEKGERIEPPREKTTPEKKPR